MARKRAYKKREDYRKGGRVAYQIGGRTDEDLYGEPDLEGAGDTAIADQAAGAMPGGGLDQSTVTTPTFNQQQINEALAAITAGASAADIAAQYNVSEDFVTSNLGALAATNTAAQEAQAAIAAREAAAKQAKAAEAAAKATQNAIASIPADGDYSQFEVNQVVDALNSGAMTTSQVASQFGLTEAQVQAELERINQFKAGEQVTGVDPFGDEGVYGASKNELAKKAKAAQLENINLTRVDDPATTVDESTQRVPGAIVQDYQRIDPNVLTGPGREATTFTPEQLAAGTTTKANIEALDAYVDIQPPTDVSTAIFSAAKGNLAQAAAAGEVLVEDYDAFLANELNNNPQFARNINRPPITVQEIRQLSRPTVAAEVDPRLMTLTRAQRTTDVGLTDDAFVPQIAFRENVTISPTKEAEKQTREAITGTAATSEAARITDTIDFETYKRREVSGTAAKDAAIQFTAEVADIQPNLARTIVENPATVEAQLDNEQPEVVAAVAALPTEALVSSQMESLLAGMESGQIPPWAKPAYDAVNQNLTQRGLGVSTVGRDALFNAIIQTALPIAQSNAQALQARAAQNLSNEQQANLQRAQLDATRKLNNLANSQTAVAQTAQFAQNLNVLQSQFNQERDTLSFQQQQQIRLSNLQNTQRTAELNAQSENAFKAQSLGNEQQIELANLEIRNQTEQQNMTAENQERLVEMQVAADFLSRNAGFAQQMQLANLNAEQQTRLANLTAQNQADAQSLTAAQQTELANLNSRMQTNLMQGRIAQSMGIALLSADQQAAVANATNVARLDLAKFSDAQQVELANSRFMQTVTLADFNANQQTIMQDATALASLDLATADQRTRLAITQAQNFLQRDMANLSNEQQSLVLNSQQQQQRLLSNQASINAAAQFNATSENQLNQFNASLASQVEQFNAAQQVAMEQFNVTEANRVAALNAGNAIDVAKFNNQLETQLEQFNESMDLQREQWNAANAQAVEQSNIQWRRQSNTIDTAATNAANQENAARSFQITSADQNFIWQSLRDEAAYLRQAYESTEQRKTTLYATAIANEVDTGAVGIQPIVDIVDRIIT